MTDSEIIALYFARDEQAIRETGNSYGRVLFHLSLQLLKNREDAEENRNDTYMTAWNKIPPERPQHFLAYLEKICRNHALMRIRRNHARKRFAEIVSLTEELENCLPASSFPGNMGDEDIGALLTDFLELQTKENRIIFIRRYWGMESVREIAARYGWSEARVKSSLFRTRKQLKTYLEKEGVKL